MRLTMHINCSVAFAKQILMLLLFSVLIAGCSSFSTNESDNHNGAETSYRADAPEYFFTTDVQFDRRYFTDMRASPSAKQVDSIKTTEYYNSDGLHAIKAINMHAHNFDGTGQIISMLDTPVDMGHNDLKGSFVAGYDASSGITSIDATNCRVALCNANHGTHIAGVLTGNKNNEGILGVAYNAKIKSVAIFDNNHVDDINNTQFYNAIRAASDPTITAMNNSWGSTATSRVTYGGQDLYFGRAPGRNFIDADGDVIHYGLRRAELNAWHDAVAQGTIVVFANENHGLNSETGMVKLYDNKDRTGDPVSIVSASDLFGTENANIPGYRGSYAAIDEALQGKWLTVIAVNPTTHIIDTFSNGCGMAQDFCLAAPGSSINSTTRYGGYGTADGTSVATPYVSGSLALLKQAFPSLSSEETVALLLATATDLGEAGTDPVYGRGMINLQAAIAPQGMLRVVGYDNNPLATGTLVAQSSITLSNHFGTTKTPLTTGVRDNYNRTFIATPAQILRQPVTFGLEDYMNNLIGADNRQENIIKLNEKTTLNLAGQQVNADNLWAMTYLGNRQAVTKISYQENYQHDDLSSIGITRSAIIAKPTILQSRLRFVDIRPVATDILTFQTEYGIKDIWLTPYAVRGHFDTSNAFQELGADINYQYDNYLFKIGLGSLHEHQQFMGATTTGAYAIRDKSQTHFNEVHVEHQLLGGQKYLNNHHQQQILKPDAISAEPTTSLIIHANYIDYRTDVPMAFEDFVRIDNLSANRYQIGLKANHLLKKNDRLDFNITTKLGIRTGTLQQNSVKGYRVDGSFQNISQSYSLASNVRHRQMVLTYQGALFSNRTHQTSFFVTLKYDENYHHYAGLTQNEFLAGLQTNF